jgi:two-component system sensor histidine kinase HydH
MDRARRWDLWGALAGAALGIGDLALLAAPAEGPLASREAVAVGFISSLALVGFFAGRLAMARARARRDAAVIRDQLEALERAQRRLLEQEKLAAIGRLAAEVAHGVRNPLGVIRASASMVQESFDPEDDAHRACRFICEEIDRLNALTASLLTFARPAEPKLTNVSLEKLVDRALHLAGEEIRARQLVVQREVEPGLEDVRADPDLLAQVLLGLLVNAAQAVRVAGRILVRVGGEAESVWVEVADDGPGVSPQSASQVFEPFYTTKASGTGLGLATALRIVEAHAGRLELLSGRGAGDAGAGACFRMSLPRQVAEGARARGAA